VPHYTDAPPHELPPDRRHGPRRTGTGPRRDQGR
jgi:hypothetical protein